MAKFGSKIRWPLAKADGDVDREFIQSWIDRSHEEFLEQFRRQIIYILVLIEIVIFFTGRELVKNSLLVTNSILIFLMIFSPYINKLLLHKRLKLITIMLVVNNLGYGWTLKSVLDISHKSSEIIPLVVLNIFSIGISIIINRLNPIDNAIFAVSLTLFSVFIYVITGYRDSYALDHFIVLATWSTCAYSIYYWRFQAAYRAALLEKNQGSLFKKAEQLRLESLEHELRLAQEIQDSISTPSGFSINGGISGHFFQKKHGFLGGDWMGSFQDTRGRMHIVIVDVTGKGVPAALVVHAVQALWAAASSDLDFEPQQWIMDLNKTLLTLGQKSPQTLSLGLITISGKMVTYESAGHVPLYFITEQSGVQEVKSMRSRGNILGMSEDLSLVSETIDLDLHKALWVIGGTDGVFVSGTRLSPRGASLMLQKILDRKPQDLLTTDANDDKILLVLEKSA